jgi:signal transduction histidine kinase
MRTELQQRSDSLVCNLKRSVEVCFEILRSIGQFYASSHDVSRQDFGTFVQPALVRHPSIHALEWLPRLSHAQRSGFEQQIQAQGYPDFHMTERSPDNRITSAGQRAEYVPVLYVEPFERNRLALGFDLASDPIRRDALEKARDSGNIVVSRRIELVQETDNQLGFLVILPIYQNGITPTTVAGRRQTLQGFLLGVFRLADVVRAALPGLDLEHVDFVLHDKSSGSAESFLAFYDAADQKVFADPAYALHKPGQTEGKSGYQESLICTRTFSVTDRQWSLLLLPTAHYVDRLALVQQSQLTADAATARANHLKQVLESLQAAQHRWVLEKKLITGGIGLVLILLMGMSILTYETLTHLIPHPIELQRLLLLDGSGIFLVFVMLIAIYYLLRRQIQERSFAEAVLWQTNDELETQIQAKTAELDNTREISELKLQLFSMASHEFRTPLSTILISAQALEKSHQEDLDERKLKYLLRIRAAAKLMAQLLSDMLTLTRAEVGKLDCKPDWIPLEPFCRRLVEELQLNDLEGHTIALSLQTDQDQVYVDEQLLYSILVNLLSNSLKYSPAHSLVDFKIHSDPQTLQFQICDRGIGILPIDLTHLFEAFYRGGNVGEIKGTGLGLAVVKTCLDRLGGQISVESQLDQGSQFTVTLPLSQAS